MCGIAGVLSLDDRDPPSRSLLLSMVGAVQHRGPDEFGIYRDAFAGLGHARLSIIDLTTGQQPLSNEDGTVWVVFNGEIFNYIELREQLNAAGHRFRTRSDTEVIVHAYEEWGDAAFDRFNGQWAVALWDTRERTLVLARDPFGVRPLYVCEHAGRLFFASEVKAIFAADSAIPRAFDPIGIDQVFTFWCPVAPRTVFQGVAEIEPGSVYVANRGRLRKIRSWQPRFPTESGEQFQGTLDDAVAAVREELDRATHLRMVRADVPVGAYLSGGLDSSLVASLGVRAKGERFQTFSLRFDDAEYDESKYQRLMSRHLGSEHHEVTVTRADIARVFPDVVAHTERPVLRTAPAPLYLLSRLVRQSGIKVVLTGEGADEVFAGYDVFREAKVRRFWARQPESEARPRLLEHLYPYLARSPVAQKAMSRQFFGLNLDEWGTPGFGHDLRWRSARALRRVFSEEQRRAVGDLDVRRELIGSLPAEFARWSFLAQDQYLEIRTLLAGYILSSQGDRMLMAHSVEGRFPFLDRRVASLADSLPPSYKLRVLDEKHVLKRAARSLVPKEIWERKKQPYRAPDALAFGAPEAQEWIAQAATERAIAEAGIFNRSAVTQVLRKCGTGATGQFSNADNMAAVGILSTQLLHECFMRRRPQPGTQVIPQTIVDRVIQPATLV